eukprot:CAMPEP_0176286024 /NCGR_PEP_ID=MMETSP0121_2-20121125/52681_1 /TAXON_ID=160619 /ORGANISM="Kryptoperidinium foliaceum, Strain CCMP 1326" /LENGTH=43 /DNA_ID= /DNA_START= /DNA_END= /DNA_ORIENTATION=
MGPPAAEVRGKNLGDVVIRLPLPHRQPRAAPRASRGQEGHAPQ